MLVGTCEGRREACYVVTMSAASSTFATDAIVTMFWFQVFSACNVFHNDVVSFQLNAQTSADSAGCVCGWRRSLSTIHSQWVASIELNSHMIY